MPAEINLKARDQKNIAKSARCKTSFCKKASTSSISIIVKAAAEKSGEQLKARIVYFLLNEA